jgi:hypothetical protein
MVNGGVFNATSGPWLRIKPSKACRLVVLGDLPMLNQLHWRYGGVTLGLIAAAQGATPA